MKELVPGERFGRLVVLAEAERIRSAKGRTFRMARCRCDCGTVLVVKLENIRSGNSQSCGCLKREVAATAARDRFSFQGGLSKTEPVLYRTWSHMIARCERVGSKDYSNYGGRGIKVCARWHDFRLFVEDVNREIGPRPSPKHSFDRKDNDGNYEPGKVRWATKSEQNANRRDFRTRRMGVSLLPSGRYQARVSIGVFGTVEEAVVAYQRVRVVLTEAGLL